MTLSRGDKCLLLQGLRKRASRRRKRNIAGITTDIATIRMMSEDISVDGEMMTRGVTGVADQSIGDGGHLRIPDRLLLFEGGIVMNKVGDRNQLRQRIVEEVDRIETEIMIEGGAEIPPPRLLNPLHRNDDGRLIGENLILRVETIETTEAMVLADRMEEMAKTTGGTGQIRTVSEETAAMTGEMMGEHSLVQRTRLQKTRRQSVNES
jgi:hypothetical protein